MITDSCRAAPPAVTLSAVKRALIATVLTASTVTLATACSSHDTGASRQSPPTRPATTSPTPTGTASGGPDAPLMYRDAPINLGSATSESCTKQYVYFGTSYAKPYVSTDMPQPGDSPMLFRSCPGGGGNVSFAADGPRYGYRASGVRDQRGCVKLAKAARAQLAEIPLSDLSPGQQFCVLSLYDGGDAVDVDLVTVQRVSPAAGTLTLAVTGWGDDL